MSSDWMFTGHWYPFQNKYGVLPDVEIEKDYNLEENLSFELRSSLVC